MFRFRSFSIFIILLIFCSVSISAYASDESLDESLEHKIGQMLMVGFRGMALDDDHFIRRDIRQHYLGGVILFDYDVVLKQPKRNISSPSQVKSLIASLKQAATTPLLVAVDQEGGRVARLKTQYGFPATVSHGELGRMDDPQVTYDHAAGIAEVLAEAGFNLNFAPVVDLCNNPDNPVIARLERCFSDGPAKVTQHALEYIRAHQSSNVLTALKHFPGHGSSHADSHLGFTDVSKTWNVAELQPYVRLLAENAVNAVMTAHVFNAGLDTKYPATLSYPIITGLLRDQLGFDGVIFSDDLQMAAITEHYGLEQAVRLALQAGVDILLFGNNLNYDPQIVPRVVAIIHNLVAQGHISVERIDQSYRRIVEMKGMIGG